MAKNTPTTTTPGLPGRPAAVTGIVKSGDLYVGFTSDWAGAAAGNFRPGRSLPTGVSVPDLVFIHTMDGFFAGTRAWFNTGPTARGGAGSSSHFGVSKLGQIDQYVRFSDTAFHAGMIRRPKGGNTRWSLMPSANPNSYSVGIENEDDNNPAGYIWSDVQVHANAWIIAMTAIRFGWPGITTANVAYHSDIDTVSRAGCPGPGAPSKTELVRLARLYLDRDRKK